MSLVIRCSKVHIPPPPPLNGWSELLLHRAEASDQPFPGSARGHRLRIIRPPAVFESGHRTRPARQRSVGIERNSLIRMVAVLNAGPPPSRRVLRWAI